MNDLAEIGAVLQHQVERAARKWLAANRMAGSARPRFALDAAGVEFLLQQPDRDNRRDSLVREIRGRAAGGPEAISRQGACRSSSAGDWASRAPQPLPVNFVHAEWITPHDNPGFAASSISCARGWTASAAPGWA